MARKRSPKAPSASSQTPKIRADDSIFPHSETSSNGMRVRIVQVRDTTAAITQTDWKRQLSLSRQLFGRMGQVSGSIRTKATYAVGSAWVPQFKGKDRAWGKLAEEWLHHWFKRCNVRGQPFTFQQSLRIDSIAIDRDGDQGMLFVTGPNGEPMLQWIPTHRIDSRVSWGQDTNGFGRVPTGRKFAGFKSYNGLIYGPAMNVVGYNILGDTPEQDRIVDAESFQLLYEPDWVDQGRGIPRAVSSLLGWMDLEDIEHFLKRQVKQDSAMGLLHYNENGTADSERDFIEGGASESGLADISVEKMEGNEILYFRAQGGGKIEPFTSNRPSPNVDAFTKRILRGCHVGLGWPIELTDPSTIGGASTRLIQDIARRTIAERQEALYSRAIRAVMWGLSAAMENTRELPRSTGDWWNWTFTLPAKLTVDARYDEKSAMDRIRMAAGTYSNLFGERGEWWQEEIDQRIEEQLYIEQRCKERGVDPGKVQMLTPNGSPPPLEDSADTPDDTTDPEDDTTDPNDANDTPA